MENNKILVIGDLILDEYIIGEDYHISDEAPVPILRVDKFVPKLGGAANVANNIRSLGGDVLLCGCIGKVSNGRSASRFIEQMAKNNLSIFYIVQGEVKTTTKSRVIIKNQQVVRFDYEDSSPPKEMIEELLDKLKFLDFSKIGLIVVSDYKKGIITDRVVNILRASGVKIVIDPKPLDDGNYNNVFCMTPNLKEFNLFTGSNFNKDNLDGLSEAADDYRKKLNLENIVITLGDKGAMCCMEGRCEIVSNHKVEVANTIGAGDTFLSALCYEIVIGKDIFEATMVANIAAAIVVSKKYTGVCSMREIDKYRRNEKND